MDQLCAGVAALEADDDVLIEAMIAFQGTALPFVVDVFKVARTVAGAAARPEPRGAATCEAVMT